MCIWTVWALWRINGEPKGSLPFIFGVNMGLIAKTTVVSKLGDLLNKIQKQAIDIAHNQDKKGKVTLNVTPPKKISRMVLDERVTEIVDLLKKEMKPEFEKMLDERFSKHIDFRHQDEIE